VYTVRLGDKELPINDLPALAAKVQLGQIPPEAPVFDHVNAAWTTVAVLLRAMGARPAPPGAAAPLPPLYYPQAPGYPAAPFAKRTPGTAVASLVLSAIGFCTCFVLSILGIVFGYSARSTIDANPDLYAGRELATAGIVIGWIAIAISAIVAIGTVLYVASLS